MGGLHVAEADAQGARTRTNAIWTKRKLCHKTKQAVILRSCFILKPKPSRINVWLKGPENAGILFSAPVWTVGRGCVARGWRAGGHRSLHRAGVTAPGAAWPRRHLRNKTHSRVGQD